MSFKRSILSFVVFILFISFSLPISYIFREYTVADGLCQTQVTAIFQDSKGRMWFGTYGGISLYDGVKFKNFFVSSGLLNATIFSICEDNEGQIWVGTQGGVFFFNGEKFKKVFFKKFDNSAKITQILFDKTKNRLFMCFSNKILEYYPDTRREIIYKIKNTHFIFSYYSLFLDANGNFFFTDGEKIYSIKNGRIEEIKISGFKLENNNAIQKIYRKPKSLTWYILTTENFHIIKENLDKTYVIKLNDPNDYFTDFTFGKNGGIWIITSNKLFYVKNNKLVRKTLLKKKSTEGVLNKILCDYEGNIWIGEDGGVLKKIPENLLYIDKEAGLQNEFIWIIKKYRENKVFVGTERGFQILNLNDFSFSKVYLSKNAILDILKLKEGRYLVLTDDGVYYFDGQKTKTAYYYYKGQKIDLRGYIFYRGYKFSSENYLLAGNSGVILVKGKDVMRLKLPEEINRREVLDIVKFDEKKNGFLLGTYNGVYYFEFLDKIAKNVKLLFLKNINISLIYRSDDKFYIGALGLGIFELSRRLTLEALPSKNKLNNLNVWSILKDGNKLWIGTSRGISYYDLKNKKIVDFNELMNIPYSEIPGKRSFCKIRDGYILFGTSKGIIVYRKTKNKNITEKIHPKFLVDSIAIDGKFLKNIPKEIKMSYKSNLTLNLRCMSFYNERGNKFFYMIQNMDKNFKLARGNSLYFQYLKPGNYKLIVYAVNSRGVPSKDKFSINLIITPPLLQTLWFQLLIFLLIALIIFGLGFYKYNLSKKREKILKKEVEKRTRELKETEERYRLLVEATLIPVFLVDFEGNILFANSKVREILDLSPEDKIGSIKDYILPADYGKVAEVIEKRKKGFKDHAEYEIRIFTKKGEIKNIILHSVTINYQGKDLVLVNALEITKQKNLQKRLSKMQRLDALGVFAGGIAHNLNNLLQIIAGALSILKGKALKNEPFEKEINTIEENLNKISEMVKQILGFSGKEKYLIELIDIHELLDEAIGNIYPKIGDKNIEILTNYEKMNIFIEGDKKQLLQCIQNILTNSIEAIEDRGKIFVETRIITKNYAENMKDHILEAGKYVEIVIIDDGEGFPPEIKDKVFDPFFTTKDFKEHKGFGLSIAYGIIKNQDGYIYIDSKEGAGTKVNILLPLPPTTISLYNKGNKDISEEEENYNYIFEDKNILLIGNAPINFKIKRALENFGFYVTVTEGKMDEIKELSNKKVKIDVVILNLEEFEYKTVLFKLIKRELGAEKIFVILNHIREEKEITEKVKSQFDNFETIIPPYSIPMIIERIKDYFLKRRS